MFYSGMFYGLYVMSVYKTSSQMFLSDQLLTIIGAIGAISNGLSRVITGALQDRYGFKKVHGIIMVI